MYICVCVRVRVRVYTHLYTYVCIRISLPTRCNRPAAGLPAAFRSNNPNCCAPPPRYNRCNRQDNSITADAYLCTVHGHEWTWSQSAVGNGLFRVRFAHRGRPSRKYIVPLSFIVCTNTSIIHWYIVNDLTVQAIVLRLVTYFCHPPPVRCPDLQ